MTYVWPIRTEARISKTRWKCSGRQKGEGINLRRGEIQWRRRVHWWKCSLNPLWIQCDSCNATDDSDERGRGRRWPGSSAFETEEGPGVDSLMEETRGMKDAFILQPGCTICDHLFNWFVKVTASKWLWKGMKLFDEQRFERLIRHW